MVGDETNLLAEFYSCGQKANESEEAFAEELQSLVCKVISKKPNFRKDLGTTPKQCYASQLYDKNSASIAKTLLMQMPQMSFMQFRNELARVLGTHQQSGGKTSAKTASTSAVEVKAKEKSPQTKSKSKKKIKDQCAVLTDQGPSHQDGPGSGGEFPN